MKNDVKRLSEAKLHKNTVIIRANLDIRLENGELVDDTKVRALIPTLNFLQKAECKTIILTHAGENCTEYKDELSLIPIRFAIGRALNKPIKFVSISNCQNSIKFMEFGDILLLENLCFSKEEFSGNEKTREEFVRNITQFADHYIDESFGVNPKLSSVKYLPKLLPTLIGLNYEEEIKAIEILGNEEKPGFVGLVGGEIKSEKFKLIKHLIKKSEKILLGGEVALTFLAANDIETKNNKLTSENISEAKDLIELAKIHKCELVLPKDALTSEGKKLNVEDLSKQDEVFDIGPKTTKEFIKIIEAAKTIVANGPMGKFELTKFGNGTTDVYEILSLLSTKEIYKVAGGESTTEAIHKLSIKHKKYNHISSGIFELAKLIE